jgi:hypothetical protein
VNARRTALFALSTFLTASIFAANPFLNATDDKPVFAKFRGTEWGDNIQGEEVPLTARVVTTQLTKMAWGQIFKIEFKDITSRAKERREIKSEYFIVTDDRILLLNEEDNDAAVKQISALEKPPPFEQGDVYGIIEGEFSFTQGPWETKIKLKGDQCIYSSSHNSSGHFKKVVWQKGVGLVEYSMGYGARADGFRLKRSLISGK